MNAGVDELGKAAQSEHAKDMHALVMFVQTGPQKERQYKIAMVKTEEQADMEELADQFCERGSTIWTDQMKKYFVLAQTWEHVYVNHYRLPHRQGYSAPPTGTQVGSRNTGTCAVRSAGTELAATTGDGRVQGRSLRSSPSPGKPDTWRREAGRRSVGVTEK
jgi:hypothetical protein